MPPIRSLLFLLALSLGGMPRAATAAAEVNLVVLRENGVGSAAQAQPYLDALVDAAAKVNGWPAASGKYFRSRAQATAYISANKPAIGILSLGAYLALRRKLGLKVIGSANVADAGGRRYHLISKTAAGVDGCKGRRVASDHLKDPRFIEKVVAKGAFKLSEFQVVETQRPLQTVKKVIRDEAVCALIDDAQFRDLKNVEGGSGVKSVWKSAQLPPMVVVSFGGADAKVVGKFKSRLGLVCSGAGMKACGEVGIRALVAAGDGVYRGVVKAYGG